jgi:hypothetical protein
VKQEKLEEELLNDEEEKTTQSFVDSNDVNDNGVSDELQTTLHVSTLFPSATSAVFLEVFNFIDIYFLDNIKKLDHSINFKAVKFIL